MGHKTTFMAPDLPVDERTVNRFLRGMKTRLIEWGGAKKSIQFDLDAKSLSVGGSEVLQASIKDSVLDITWLNRAWGDWKELREDSKFIELVQGLQGKLSQSKGRLAKGKGKGSRRGQRRNRPHNTVSPSGHVGAGGVRFVHLDFLRPFTGEMSVAAWNVEGLTDIQLHEVKNFMLRNNISITCIQETRVSHTPYYIAEDGF